MTTTLIWAIVGLLAILSELTMGSFFLLFLGLSALIVAGARLLGLDNLLWEALLFSALSLASILLFRKKLLASFRVKGQFRIDNSVLLEVDMAPGATTSISYQGSMWTAVNVSNQVLKAGETAHIVKIEGVKLFLTPSHS